MTTHFLDEISWIGKRTRVFRLYTQFKLNTWFVFNEVTCKKLYNQIFPSHPAISANSRCDAKWHTSFTKLRASPSIDSVLDCDVGHMFWHKNGSVYRLYLSVSWKCIYYITCICILKNIHIYYIHKYLTKTHVLKDQFRILQVGWFMA